MKEGYRNLIAWQLAAEIRRKVYRLTIPFAKEEMRRISQMRDCARSVKQNIQEGYRKSMGHYIHALDTSRGSLSELMGDIEDCFEDGLIMQIDFDTMINLCRREDYILFRLIQSLRNKAKESK